MENIVSRVLIFMLLILRKCLFIYKGSEGRQRTLAITGRLSRFKVWLDRDVKLVTHEKINLWGLYVLVGRIQGTM